MNYQLSASQLMQKCKQNMSNNFCNSPLKFDSNSTSARTKKSKINLAELGKISPKQQEQNNKIIQKLRKKAKKKQKQLFIRKTDLGQNQKIFNAEELQKLKQIDQQQFLGKPHKKKADEINQTDKQDLCQIRESQNHRKFFVNENTQEQISKYLQWVDLKSFSNVEVKKRSKILNFQKNEKSHVENMQTKYSLPSLSTNGLKTNKNFRRSHTLKGRNSIPFNGKQTLDNNSFINSARVNQNSKILTVRQKLNNLIMNVNRNISHQLNNSNKYIYMTEQRKQALLQCETLKKIKSQMGMKFYKKLQLAYGNNENNIVSKENIDEHNKQNYNNSFSQNSYLTSNIGLSMYGANQQLTEAERVLQKNNNRIKQQRKRVIQKLIC